MTEHPNHVVRESDAKGLRRFEITVWGALRNMYKICLALLAVECFLIFFMHSFSYVLLAGPILVVLISPAVITIDTDGVRFDPTFWAPRGTVRRISWSELSKVEVVSMAPIAGPRVRLFAGGSSITIPLGAVNDASGLVRAILEHGQSASPPLSEIRALVADLDRERAN